MAATGESTRRGPDTLVLFLGALAVLAAAYTLLAFDMEWRTEAGRIGPGFFPRLVGATTVVLCGLAIVRALLPAGRQRALDQAAGSQETHARLTVAAVGCMALLLFTLEDLGAILASALFLGVFLSLVNPGRHRFNAVLSVLLPVALYVFLDIALNAGLPPGVIPF